MQSAKNVPVFGFCRKLAHTNPQQITVKGSEHNTRTLFSRVSTGGDNFVLYPLSSINFTSSLFLPNYIFASASAIYKLRCPLGSVGHAKLFDHVSSQPPNKSNTKKIMHPAAVVLYPNHHVYGDAYTIVPRLLQPPPPLTLEIILKTLEVSGINDVFSYLLLFLLLLSSSST